MHYYQFNIGDYRRDTIHLSRLEHSIYRDLIDWYFLDEKPIPNDEKIIYRKLRLTGDEEKEALVNVLNDFFCQTDDGWVHGRIEEDIAAYYGKSEKARESVKKRWEKEKGIRTNNERNTNEVRTNNERNTNQEPLTNNHKPITNNQEHTPTTVPNSNQEPITPTPAACVCRELKNFGFSDLNPAHPLLLELLKAGSTIDEFVYAARTAKEKGKGFKYILGIVKSQRAEALAASKQVLHGDLPNKSPPGNSKKFQKFSGFDYINGGDGYGNKREPDEGRIIDGEVAVDVPKIQGKEAN